MTTNEHFNDAAQAIHGPIFNQSTLQNRLQLIIDNMPVMMDAFDESGTIILWNKECERITGYTATEMIGNRDAMALLYPDNGYRQTVIDEISASPLHFRDKEYTLTCKDGSEKTIIWSNISQQVPVPGWQTWAVGSDVSERDRTQHLESLAVVAGGLAHDFNNLLGGMLGNIELARNNIDNKEMALRFIERAITAFDRAKALTQQLLTFSKRTDSQKRIIELKPLITEAINLSLSGTPVACTPYISQELKTVCADSSQIVQVLNNLLINATHAMSDGGTITITAQNRNIINNEIHGLCNGPYIELAICDEGTGIPEALIPRIFDPFFSTKPTGSGLGLATSYSIIQRHNGTITVNSEVAKGTTFTVYLPIVAGKVHKDIIVPDNDYQFSGRVLVMDDEEIMRELAQQILEQSGFQVVVTQNGEQAIETFSKEFYAGTAFDFLLFDLTVTGGISGDKAMKRILEIDPNALGIVASGYTNNPVLAEPKKFGFASKVIKPYHIHTLQKAFSEIQQC